LVTAFPLVYGLNVQSVALRNLALDGNRDQQPAGIGSCRGAAIYFIGSRDIEVSDVLERGFVGEGLGFQMCRDVRIRGCQVAQNTGNGFHPGAGSTASLFEDCVAEGNDAAGFFFCVRANHITVRSSTFRGNHVCGISVGTRDCHNRVVDCQMADNAGPGLLIRHTSRPVEVHSCLVSGCRISNNASDHGHAQVDILGDAHDLILTRNEIRGDPQHERAGVYLAPSTERIWLGENRIAGCHPAVVGNASPLASEEPQFECGIDAVQEKHYRHLAG
jgi:nitrous oxidase accessory protein NosD